MKPLNPHDPSEQYRACCYSWAQTWAQTVHKTKQLRLHFAKFKIWLFLAFRSRTAKRYTMSDSIAIDLEQLQAELQSARGAFDKWALDTVSAADHLRETHIRNIADFRGTAFVT